MKMNKTRQRPKKSTEIGLKTSSIGCENHKILEAKKDSKLLDTGVSYIYFGPVSSSKGNKAKINRSISNSSDLIPLQRK